jgi:transcriptional regulator with XRE-family HTH domain
MPVKEVRQMGWTRKSAGVSVLLAMEEHRKQAGIRVLQLREARRWTHEDLAHAAGVSVKTVSRFEKGRVEGRRGTVRKIAEALGVDEADIVGLPPAPLGLGVPAVSQLDRIEKMLESVTPAATKALRDDPRDARELAAMHAKLDDLQEAVDRIEGYLREQASAAVRERVKRAARQQSKRRDTRRADPATEDG